MRGEEEEEDGEGQVEVESERGELKERTHMYMDDMTGDSELEPRGACDPTSKCDEDYALSVHAQVLCILRVFMFVVNVLVVDVVGPHACPQCSCSSSCCICIVLVASFL